MKKKFNSIFYIIIGLAVATIIYGFLGSKFRLSVTHYSIMAQIEDSIKIVQLTDQHNSIFGKNNSKLIEKIESEQPDLICITGDQINQDSLDKDIEQACMLIHDLCNIAPVYVSYGNHEAGWDSGHSGEHISDRFKSAGATVLEYSWQDIMIKNSELRIGGIYGYCLPNTFIGEFRQNECDFLHDFEDTERYKLLLCHMPVCWISSQGLNSWDINLVLSGHLHGGQIRLPIVGGLYAPDMGFFPGAVKGLYTSDDGERKMILSSGLGSYDKLPRFNNPPEIVIIDLLSDG